ncbi:MAG: hypothetical protein WC444_05520 [Candidatus Paceibacterota bacterium]
MGIEQSLETQVAVIAQRIESIEGTVNEIKSKLENEYITNDKHELLSKRVELLERIVFGVVSIVLIAVGGAIISLVIQR